MNKQFLLCEIIMYTKQDTITNNLWNTTTITCKIKNMHSDKNIDKQPIKEECIENISDTSDYYGMNTKQEELDIKTENFVAQDSVAVTDKNNIYTLVNLKRMRMEKKRCANFTRDEVEVLVDLVEAHKEVIECKKTDAITSGAKEVEWQKLAVKFNAVAGTGRTAKMLRSKWDSLKKIIRKEYADYKQSYYRTDGGSTVEIKLNDVENKVLALLGVETTGTVSQWDSDFAEEIHNQSEAVTLDEIAENVSLVTNVEIVEVPSFSRNSGHSLKVPKTKVLRFPKSSTMDSSTADSEAGPDILKTASEAPINNTPNKFQAPSPVTNTTKRKRFCKMKSTSAKLQKQRSVSIYEEVARKKIEFIEFQMALLKEEAEKREQRLAEKHALELKILEAELKNKENFR